LQTAILHLTHFHAKRAKLATLMLTFEIQSIFCYFFSRLQIQIFIRRFTLSNKQNYRNFCSACLPMPVTRPSTELCPKYGYTPSANA